MAEDYQFDDLDSGTDSSAEPSTESSTESTSSSGVTSSGGSSAASSGGSGSSGYATELFSKQIKAKFRTFFIDLKESSNGKFIKISEKSHGRKSTIMMDAEDVPVFIEALKEVSEHL